MTKKNHKMHSFVKMLLWMAVGACIGATIGMMTFFMEDGLKGFFYTIYSLISRNAGVLLILLAIFALVFSVICYVKGNQYAKLSSATEEEEQQDCVDAKFDFWIKYWSYNIKHHIIYFVSDLCFSRNAQRSEHYRRRKVFCRRAACMHSNNRNVSGDSDSTDP